MLIETTAAESNVRASQSAGQVLFGKGGLGYIARRGVDFGSSASMMSLEGLARMATMQPLELLSLLPDIVPEVGFALWNGTYLGSGPDAIRIKAMTRTADGGSEEAPEGTAAIADLWDNQPKEIGDLVDCLGQNYQMLQFSGLCAAEALPGPRMKGVAAVFPVNSLTLRFKRETSGQLTLYQRQTANPNGLGIYSAGFGGFFVPMPMERFFWSKLPGLPDEPYGRAPLSPVLTIVLEILAYMRDLMLAHHRVGSPSLDVGFDFVMWHKIAIEQIGLTDDLEIDAFVQKAFNRARQFYADKNPDDAYFHDLNTKVSIVGSGGEWGQTDKIWAMLQLRLMQALKTLPTLMGIHAGSTETWSKVEWDIFAAALKSQVVKAAAPLVNASSLHLQLLGMPYTAVAEYSEIQSITRKLDADAEKQEIDNEARKRDEGWQSQETAAMAVTGSAPVADPRSWRPATVTAPAPVVTIAEAE